MLVTVYQLKSYFTKNGAFEYPNICFVYEITKLYVKKYLLSGGLKMYTCLIIELFESIRFKITKHITSAFEMK